MRYCPPRIPRTDQFSFCVALYEALYGQRPFVDRIAEIDERSEDLREPPGPSPVPLEIWALLRRGLSLDPAERWPSMEALVEALRTKLAGFDQSLADPGVQRLPQIVFAMFAAGMILAMAALLYSRSDADGGRHIGLLPFTLVHVGITIIYVALFVFARSRWRQVKPLQHLLGTYAVCASGVLVHDLISLYAGRDLYQNMLAVQPTFIVVFTVAALAYARWMAWIAALYLGSLLLLLALPERSLIAAGGASALGWMVVVIAWRRLVKKHGHAMARPHAAGRSNTGSGGA